MTTSEYLTIAVATYNSYLESGEEPITDEEMGEILGVLEGFEAISVGREAEADGVCPYLDI